MREFLFEVTCAVDDDEVQTEEQVKAKEKEIRKAVESLDPSIGIFTVENWLS